MRIIFAIAVFCVCTAVYAEDAPITAATQQSEHKRICLTVHLEGKKSSPSSCLPTTNGAAFKDVNALLAGVVFKIPDGAIITSVQYEGYDPLTMNYATLNDTFKSCDINTLFADLLPFPQATKQQLAAITLQADQQLCPAQIKNDSRDDSMPWELERGSAGIFMPSPVDSFRWRPGTVVKAVEGGAPLVVLNDDLHNVRQMEYGQFNGLPLVNDHSMALNPYFPQYWVGGRTYEAGLIIPILPNGAVFPDTKQYEDISAKPVPVHIEATVYDASLQPREVTFTSYSNTGKGNEGCSYPEFQMPPNTLPSNMEIALVLSHPHDVHWSHRPLIRKVVNPDVIPANVWEDLFKSAGNPSTNVIKHVWQAEGNSHIYFAQAEDRAYKALGAFSLGADGKWKEFPIIADSNNGTDSVMDPEKGSFPNLGEFKTPDMTLWIGKGKGIQTIYIMEIGPDGEIISFEEEKHEVICD